MHTLFHRLFALLFLLLPGVTGAAPAGDASLPILAATATDDLRAKDGQRIVVYGESVRSGKSTAGINFVNFKDADFALVTFKGDLKPFRDGEPADVYDGKRLVVTGVVSLYQNKPQIRLTDPAQVRVLPDGEPWPVPLKR